MLNGRTGQRDGELLTGAEAVAAVLVAHGVRIAFAYPGTSELRLCEAVRRAPGIDLVNGRGDKESAFMAGGASLLRPGTGAAILHAARGLTNACGAVADLRRSEVGCLVLVGLPSIASQPFLPPHGEPGLLDAVGSFATWSCDTTPELERTGLVPAAADGLLARLGEALRAVATPPSGPALFGIPQDAADRAWVPRAAVERAVADAADRPGPAAPSAAGAPPAGASASVDAAAAELLRRSRRPAILVDDPLLHQPGARPALRALAAALAAPVLQVRYSRGPVLFERLSAQDVPQFAGWYAQDDPRHRAVLNGCDLLVTVEDRNMYPRVIGPLPAGPKLAVTSAEARARKNGYLGAGDVVVAGDPVAALRRLAAALPADAAGAGGATWADALLRPAPGGEGGPAPACSPAGRVRIELAIAIARALGLVARPVLIDDSQMLGGLLCAEYDRLPARLRVHGSHGGFVGSGLATAAGLALGEPGVSVVCILGDQGFTNGVQGLAMVGHERAPVTYVVANNGGAVSLGKQALADDAGAFAGGADRFLANPPEIDYPALAAAFGVHATSIRWAPDDGADAIADAGRRLGDALSEALAAREPLLVELVLPPLGETWDGVWSTAGREAPAAGERVGGSA